MAKRLHLDSKYVYQNGTTAMYREEEDFLQLHASRVLIPQFTLIVAVWSRLAEIAVRIAFIVLTWTATLMFEHLYEKFEILFNNDYIANDNEKITGKIEECMEHYDLICQFVEKINHCFGLILLIVIAGDFAYSVMRVCEILEYMNLTRSAIMKHLFFEQKLSSKWPFLHLAHHVIRNLLLLVSSYRVDSSVIS